VVPKSEHTRAAALVFRARGSPGQAPRRAEASLPGRGRTIPPSLLHLRAPSSQRAFDTLEGSSCEAPSCGDCCRPRRRPCSRQITASAPKRTCIPTSD
jgi:hypothetical protein